jgi:hypothetical protein
MKYYTIQNNTILIADTEEALTRFYDEAFELPEDYEEGKYIIGDVEIEIDVPDYDEEGNPIMIEYEDTEVVIDYDENGEPIGSHEITVIKHKQQTHKETVTVQRLVPNPNWEQEQADRREAEFNKAFFNTSLGYVRRAVTMADGSKKDFLSDLLPVISMGVQGGMPVNILTYDEPPFDKDVTDWTEYQHQVTVTAQFIQECFLQLSADFAPINEEE